MPCRKEMLQNNLKLNFLRQKKTKYFFFPVKSTYPLALGIHGKKLLIGKGRHRVGIYGHGCRRELWIIRHSNFVFNMPAIENS